MKKLFFISVAVFLFSAGKCFCQFDITRMLDEWIGKWETSYKVEEGSVPGTAKEILTISGEDKNIYLHLHTFGWMAEDSSDTYSWVEDEFITYDFKAKGITGVFINSNGWDSQMLLKGDWEEGSNKIIREGESSWNKEKITWEVKDGKLHKSVEWTNKKKNTKGKFERLFTKSKIK